MLPLVVGRFSSSGVTKSQGEVAIFGVFFSTENALYSIAFGTRTKTAEPIEMPFGTMSNLGAGNNVLRGGDDPRRGWGNFWGKRLPDNCELDRSMQRHTRGAVPGRRLIASVGRVCYRPRSRRCDCTARAKSDIYDCLVIIVMIMLMMMMMMMMI